MASTGTSDITITAGRDIVLDADGGDTIFKDNGTTYGSVTNNSGNMILKSGTTTTATFTGANVVFAGTVDSGAITSTGQIQGTSITDGTATMTSGNLSSIGTIGCGAITSTGNSSMEQLTVDGLEELELEYRSYVN